MQATITQAIRPYLEHINRADLAVERARTDGPFGPDVDGAENAHACAFAHAQLAAKRARDALAGPAVEPVLDPSWVGTVNMDVGFDPARRRSVTTQMVAILARHSQRVHDARNHVKDCSASMQATTVALVSVLR